MLIISQRSVPKIRFISKSREWKQWSHDLISNISGTSVKQRAALTSNPGQHSLTSERGCSRNTSEDKNGDFMNDAAKADRINQNV